MSLYTLIKSSCYEQNVEKSGKSHFSKISIVVCSYLDQHLNIRNSCLTYVPTSYVVLMYTQDRSQNKGVCQHWICLHNEIRTPYLFQNILHRPPSLKKLVLTMPLTIFLKTISTVNAHARNNSYVSFLLSPNYFFDLLDLLSN